MTLHAVVRNCAAHQMSVVCAELQSYPDADIKFWSQQSSPKTEVVSFNASDSRLQSKRRLSVVSQAKQTSNHRLHGRGFKLSKHNVVFVGSSTACQWSVGPRGADGLAKCESADYFARWRLSRVTRDDDETDVHINLHGRGCDDRGRRISAQPDRAHRPREEVLNEQGRLRRRPGASGSRI